jgi:molybdopterin-biosynthesis enzyme MoeA-like protein
MPDDLSSLFKLLEHATAEVRGRAAAMPVSADVKNKLAKFACGQCDENERQEIIALIQGQPQLVTALVSEIEALRESQP